MSAHSNDLNAEHLLKLSDEVGRIANTLARLSTNPAAPGIGAEQPAREDLPKVSAQTVRAIIQARRMRSQFFPDELFAEPAWDILLDLLLGEISHQRVSVSSACTAAAVPATTALRWLNTLVQMNLVIRRADPHDARRVFVELAPESSLALRRFLAEGGPCAGL